MSYIYGIPYWNHGSCSSEQAKGMGDWATKIAEDTKEKPFMFVVVGIRDSCHPPVHFSLNAVAPVLWVPLETEKAGDALEVLSAIARAAHLDLYLDKTNPGCPNELR